MSIQNLFSANDTHLFCNTMTCNNIGSNCIHNCANVGTGSQVFKQLSGTDTNRTAEFRSLIGTGGIVITQNANDLTINDTGGAAPVQSVFGRTGTVVAVEGDYNLGQLGDVTLTAPANTNILQYNGTQWVNTVPTDTNIYNTDGTLTGPRAVGLGGQILLIGQAPTPTTPAMFRIQSGQIDVQSDSGYVYIGSLAQLQTNIQSAQLNFIGLITTPTYQNGYIAVDNLGVWSASTPSDTNIYNSDGVISDPVRTLDGNGSNLNLDNIDTFTTNGAKTHINGPTEIILTGNGTLLDTNLVVAADWQNRILYDSANVTSVSWEGHSLWDNNNLPSIGYHDRQLIDTVGALSIDWESRVLNAPSNSLSIDYTNRQLVGSSGTASIDYADSSNVVLNTLKVGGGTTIKKILSATASITFASMLTLASNDQTIAVSGALVNNTVILGEPAAPTAGLCFNAFVSASNVVTIRAFNVTAGTVTPGAQTFRVTVLNY